MAAADKFNLIFQICRVTMYFLAGLGIMFLPIPLFKNVALSFKIGMGALFMLYSGFRTYQLIQSRKNQTEQ